MIPPGLKSGNRGGQGLEQGQLNKQPNNDLRYPLLPSSGFQSQTHKGQLIYNVCDVVRLANTHKHGSEPAENTGPLPIWSTVHQRSILWKLVWVQQPQCFQLHETKSRRVAVKVKVLMTIAAIRMKTEMCGKGLLCREKRRNAHKHKHSGQMPVCCLNSTAGTSETISMETWLKTQWKNEEQYWSNHKHSNLYLTVNHSLLFSHLLYSHVIYLTHIQ